MAFADLHEGILGEFSDRAAANSYFAERLMEKWANRKLEARRIRSERASRKLGRYKDWTSEQRASHNQRIAQAREAHKRAKSRDITRRTLTALANARRSRRTQKEGKAS